MFYSCYILNITSTVQSWQCRISHALYTCTYIMMCVTKIDWEENHRNMSEPFRKTCKHTPKWEKYWGWLISFVSLTSSLPTLHIIIYASTAAAVLSWCIFTQPAPLILEYRWRSYHSDVFDIVSDFSSGAASGCSDLFQGADIIFLPCLFICVDLFVWPPLFSPHTESDTAWQNQPHLLGL